jgi:hypothetical protein
MDSMDSTPKRGARTAQREEEKEAERFYEEAGGEVSPPASTEGEQVHHQVSSRTDPT